MPVNNFPSSSIRKKTIDIYRRDDIPHGFSMLMEAIDIKAKEAKERERQRAEANAKSERERAERGS